MSEAVYEAMFIFDSARYARDPGGVANLVNQWVATFGGEVLVSRLWEERRLAYAIKNQRKGTYWLAYFRLDTLKLAELDRQCQIEDGLLRHLFLKVEPRLVETLVEHAKSGTVRSSERPRRDETVVAGVSIDDLDDEDGLDEEE